MNKIILLLEEDYIKENAFVLKKSEYQFMVQRLLLALVSMITIAIMSFLLNNIIYLFISPFVSFIAYEYPLIAMKNYKKKKQLQINADFPLWVMQLEALVVINTIPNAIKESIDVCPESFKDEVIKLTEKIMIDPVDKKAYLDFLQGYQTSDITEVMLSLHQYNFSTKENMVYDFQILHRRLDSLRTDARKEQYKQKTTFYGFLVMACPFLTTLWILYMIMTLSDLIMANI